MLGKDVTGHPPILWLFVCDMYPLFGPQCLIEWGKSFISMNSWICINTQKSYGGRRQQKEHWLHEEVTEIAAILAWSWNKICSINARFTPTPPSSRGRNEKKILTPAPKRSEKKAKEKSQLALFPIRKFKKKIQKYFKNYGNLIWEYE